MNATAGNQAQRRRALTGPFPTEFRRGSSSAVPPQFDPTTPLDFAGGDNQCMRIMQTFLNVVEFDMNIQAAIEAPRATTKGFPSSVFPHAMAPGHLSVESRISPAVIEELKSRGHDVDVNGPWSMNATSAIVIDPETGVLSAGADIRGDNYALAW